MIIAKRLNPAARLPEWGKKSRSLDVFADLGWGETLTLYHGVRYEIATGIALNLPAETHLHVVSPDPPLRGIRGLHVLSHVFDGAGELMVPVINYGSTFSIQHGDRIARAFLVQNLDCLVAEQTD